MMWIIIIGLGLACIIAVVLLAIKNSGNSMYDNVNKNNKEENVKDFSMYDKTIKK